MPFEKIGNAIRQNAWLIVIIFLAAFLRFVNLWYLEFKGDEAQNLILARDLIDHCKIPLVGIKTSVGSYAAPFFIYLIAIPSIFSKSPLVISGFIALLNVVAVYICFRFCREFFNKRIALIASAFYAVNPWAILYSRKIWNQDALPFFMIIFFYSLFKVLIKNKHAYIIVSIFALGVMTQVHQQTLLYLVTFFVALFGFAPKIPLRYYLIGIGAAAALYVPYCLFEITHNFHNVTIFFSLAKAPFLARFETLFSPLILSSTLLFPVLSSFGILSMFSVALFLAAVVFLIYRIKDKRYFLLVLWLLTPIASTAISKIQPQYYYFISLFPLPFILCGIFADELIARSMKNRFAKSLAFAFVLISVGYQFACSASFFAGYIVDRKNMFFAQYGPPFKYRVDEIRKVMDQGETRPEIIHKKLLEDEPGKELYMYDFSATKYIVEHIDAIKK